MKDLIRWDWNKGSEWYGDVILGDSDYNDITDF